MIIRPFVPSRARSKHFTLKFAGGIILCASLGMEEAPARGNYLINSALAGAVIIVYDA